jgi:uncharacterized protein (DUF2267 family)
MFKTRKEFLREVMVRAGLSSLEEADRVSQVVIGLVKATIGPEMSERVAEISPPDLSKGWQAIAIPSEVMEVQEMMFELDEVREDQEAPQEAPPPYDYG